MTTLLRKEDSKMLCPVCDDKMLKLDFGLGKSPIRFCSRCEIELIDDRLKPVVKAEQEEPLSIELPWDPTQIEME